MPRRSIDAPSIPLVGSHCLSNLCPENARVLLKGPWLVLGESCPKISTINQLKYLLYTLPPILIILGLLKATQIFYGTLLSHWTNFWTSWTFLDVLVYRLPKWLIFIKIDLKTMSKPYYTQIRLYNMSWIFEVLHPWCLHGLHEDFIYLNSHSHIGAQ